jgi:fluoroacetyl-CoA thioesterase
MQFDAIPGEQMPDAAPPIGLRHRLTMVVSERATVPGLATVFGNFSEMPPVLATMAMIGFVESTCLEALRPYLGPHQKTVGTHVDMSHSAATPVGLTVTAEVELIAVEGRKLRFKVECRDDADVIGAGFHERAIVEGAKFMARIDAKAAQKRG